MTKDEKISKIIEHTIKHFEGGYVNNKNDKGGATNFGITRKTYETYFNKTVTNEDIKNMKISEAIEIYRKNYFDSYEIDTRFPEELWHFMFDCYVQHNPISVRKIVQRALNDCGEKLVVDGVLGKQTYSKLPCYSTEIVLQYMIKWRIWLYDQIMKNDSSQLIFKDGWMNRVNWFKGNRLW